MIPPDRRRPMHAPLRPLLFAAVFAAILIFPSLLVIELFQRVLGHVAGLGLKMAVTAGWFVFAYVSLRLVFGWLMHIRERKGLTRPSNLLEDAMDALDRIAGGDYTVRLEIEDHHHRAFGELADKINRLARDLDSVERMRQEFISNVSHELQSPLTSISGFACLLKKEDLPQEKRLHYIEVIEAESRRLSKLADNLLRLSALDAEQTAVKLASFRLDKQLEDVLLMLEPQWQEKELELDISLQAVSCKGDRDLLSQVWINLLHNSIKFTPCGGMISVSLREDGDEAVCEIADTGAGIPEESLPRIFERFYKADKARDRTLGGNGLGLSLVNKIVELHGGGVSVRSQVDEGTTFTVRLPRE